MYYVIAKWDDRQYPCVVESGTDAIDALCNACGVERSADGEARGGVISSGFEHEKDAHTFCDAANYGCTYVDAAVATRAPGVSVGEARHAALERISRGLHRA